MDARPQNCIWHRDTELLLLFPICFITFQYDQHCKMESEPIPLHWCRKAICKSSSPDRWAFEVYRMWFNGKFFTSSTCRALSMSLQRCVWFFFWCSDLVICQWSHAVTSQGVPEGCGCTNTPPPPPFSCADQVRINAWPVAMEPYLEYHVFMEHLLLIRNRSYVQELQLTC